MQRKRGKALSPKAALLGCFTILIEDFEWRVKDNDPNEWTVIETLNKSIIKLESMDEICTVEVSVISNAENFYLCLWDSNDECKFIAKKYLRCLIPTFEPKEKIQDKRRIHILYYFIQHISETFLKKLKDGSYKASNSTSAMASGLT